MCLADSTICQVVATTYGVVDINQHVPDQTDIHDMRRSILGTVECAYMLGRTLRPADSKE